MKMTAFRDVTPSCSVYIQEKLPTLTFMVKGKYARTFSLLYSTKEKF